MSVWILVVGSLMGALAVATGAFGAHALQGILTDQARGWYDTAVTYHAGHALAMVVCGLLLLQSGTSANPWLNASGLCFLLGILVFSGSLYIMAFSGITRLGMITPIGGVLLISGWLCLAMGASKFSAAGV